jgi:hypothetical protein
VPRGSACGAEANASCDCGKKYVPANVKATAHPGMSDRAIAKEIGVDHKTLGRARMESGGNNSALIYLTKA